MQKNDLDRPYGLSIAGFDPSGGAGLLADAKTMEQHGVYGLTVCTAITVQHESVFQRVEWVDLAIIKAQIRLLLQQYSVNCCKIGLIENGLVLSEIINLLLDLNPAIKIVLDPIFRASAGFDFHNQTSLKKLRSCLPNIYLLTPNAQELKRLGAEGQPLMAVAKDLAKTCPVLYKGGHNEAQKGCDFLLLGNAIHSFVPTKIVQFDKHGSGCVLSAAIVSNLLLGYNLVESCGLAKDYITDFLDSNSGLLGYHNS